MSDPAAARRIRIGIDTGGTFTDVVAVDEVTGELAVTTTPSTPADPALGFMRGVHKVLGALGLDGASVSAVSHGTTVATNKLLEGKVGNLGFVTTEGYEFLLEIARQSVPDGYGNSYFWVKPDRIVPVHRVKAVGGRLAVDGSEIRPFDHDGAALVEVMTARQELSMPPTITFDQIKGFTMYATRTVLSGRGDELIDLAATNLARQIFS